MAAAAGNTFYLGWEPGLMEWLQTHLGASAISLISFFSSFGEELILILLLGFLYWGLNKKLGKSVGITVLMGMVWNTMIKNIALRRRPYFDHEGIDIYRVVEPDADIYDISAQGYSFPSGHSTNAAGTYWGLAMHTGKKWMKCLAVALFLLVGISRVVVGAHYPTDVLCGWLLGLFVAIVIRILEEKIRNPRVLYGILLATALPGLFYCRSSDYFTSFGLMIGFFAGSLVEEKAVQFENTRNPLRILLRVIGGLAIYLALNVLLKMPFSKEFLEGGSMAAMLVRTVRYAIVAFVDFCIYPMLFKVTAKIHFPGDK